MKEIIFADNPIAFVPLRHVAINFPMLKKFVFS